jgi:YHS domain-containing protein
MNCFRSMTRRALVLVVPIMASLLLAACSSKESKETQAASSDQQAQPQTTYGRAVQAARTNVAALSNPKVGFDPVCGMAIDENAVIVTIDGKDYGVCSQKCADKLRAEPEKYIVASASMTDDQDQPDD